MGLFNFFSALLNPDDHPPKTRYQEPVLTFALIQTCLAYIREILKHGGDSITFAMGFTDRNQAYDFMLFCSDLAASTSFKRENGMYVVTVKVYHSNHSLSLVAIELFSPSFIQHLADGLRRAKASGAHHFKLETDEALGELFPAFGFREVTHQTVHVGHLDDQVLATYIENLKRLHQYFRTTDLALDDHRSEKFKKYVYNKAENKYEKRTPKYKPKELVTSQCQDRNLLCHYKPLLEDDWCDYDQKYVIGPDDNRMCYEIREILKVIESQLGYETEYEEAEPQIPTDPHTMNVFTIQELAYFWVVAGNLDVRKNFPLFSAYVEAAVEGEVSNTNGPWTEKDRQEVLDILYPN